MFRYNSFNVRSAGKTELELVSDAVGRLIALIHEAQVFYNAVAADSRFLETNDTTLILEQSASS